MQHMYIDMHVEKAVISILRIDTPILLINLDLKHVFKCV